MNSVEWNPKYNLLAYAGDDKNKYQNDEGTDIGIMSLHFPSLLLSYNWYCSCFFSVSGVFRIFGFESA